MFRLEPMDEATYRAWLKTLMGEYAQQKVESGNWASADADRLAQEEFQRLLPNGRETAGHEIRSMVNDAGERVGRTWFTIEQRDAGRVVFIYDIAVDPAHRRRGYARLALGEIEAYAREHGSTGVMLHVFGNNTPARELYRSMGFEETNVMMLKRVD